MYITYIHSMHDEIACNTTWPSHGSAGIQTCLKMVARCVTMSTAIGRMSSWYFITNFCITAVNSSFSVSFIKFNSSKMTYTWDGPTVYVCLSVIACTEESKIDEYHHHSNWQFNIKCGGQPLTKLSKASNNIGLLFSKKAGSENQHRSPKAIVVISHIVLLRMFAIIVRSYARHAGHTSTAAIILTQ